MNPVRLAANELRRLSASRLSRLALAALVLIPTLYGGLYLWANRDPYAAFPQVPAAVVTEDRGTTLEGGERLQVGDRVASELVASRSFDWHAVSRAQALTGVNDGTYAFALIMPPSFSADLASTGELTPRQATLVLETNDANNYMTTMIGTTVVKEVSRSVAAEVSETAASRLLEGFTTVHDRIGEAAGGAGRLHDGIARADSGAAELAAGAGRLSTGLTTLAGGADRLHTGLTTALSGADRLQTGADQLADGLRELDARTAPLPSRTDALADGAEQVAAGNREVAGKADTVAAASTRLRTRIDSSRAAFVAELRARGLTDEQLAVVVEHLDTVDRHVASADSTIQRAADDVRRLSQGADQVADGSRRLADAMPALAGAVDRAATGAGTLERGVAQLQTGLRGLDAGAAQLDTGAAAAAQGAAELESGADRLVAGLGELDTGSATLRDELVKGRDAVPNPTDAQRKAVAQTLGNPLKVESTSLASAGSYGAGLAPMFLSLALWIGAYTLFLIVRPLSNRALAANQRSVRTALGGWLAPAAVGLVQVGVLLATVGGVLDIEIAHPVLVGLFLALVSVTWVAIVQALAARFGAPGKFLGLVLMVLQLVSAGGTFPWQTLPAPLQAAHQVLPMSYAIDGLRRLMYGADLAPVVGDVAVLVAYLAGSLLVTSAAARRLRMWTGARLKPDVAL